MFNACNWLLIQSSCIILWLQLLLQNLWGCHSSSGQLEAGKQEGLRFLFREGWVPETPVWLLVQRRPTRGDYWVQTVLAIPESEPKNPMTSKASKTCSYRANDFPRSRKTDGNRGNDSLKWNWTSDVEITFFIEFFSQFLAKTFKKLEDFGDFQGRHHVSWLFVRWRFIGWPFHCLTLWANQQLRCLVQ